HLDSIHQEFKNIKVETLSGKVTRSLHQIKTGNKEGYFFIRPFSCFCDFCLTGQFDPCQNKSFTNGNFTEHTLRSNLTNVKYSKMSDEDVDDDNDYDEGSYEENLMDEGDMFDKN
ncbi:unnamed protein product, partial [Meganyctiphanes norvegica]